MWHLNVKVGRLDPQVNTRGQNGPNWQLWVTLVLLIVAVIDLLLSQGFI